jgi:hypothetical protein
MLLEGRLSRYTTKYANQALLGVVLSYSRKEPSNVRYFAFGKTVGLLQTGGKQPKTSRECVSIYL